MKACFWSGYGVKTSLLNNYIYDICIPGALMWFDGPNQILPIFHHLIWFDGPKNLMWFDGPKSIFSPVKTSCVLMDPKPHVIWWTLTRDFKFFPSQNLMCFDGPTTWLKPHVFWWTQNITWLEGFQGPSNHMRFLGPPKHRSAQKTHVIWWTQISNLIGSNKPHEVSSAVAHFKTFSESSNVL